MFKENWFTKVEIWLRFSSVEVLFMPIFIAHSTAMLVKFSKFSYARINRI